MFPFLRSLPLFQHEVIHFFLSTLVAGGVAFLFSRSKGKRNPKDGDSLTLKVVGLIWLAALVGGFLVDADHLLDHLFAYGVGGYLNRGLLYFLTGSAFSDSGKGYVLLHSWEIFLLGGFAWYLIFYRSKSDQLWQHTTLAVLLSYGLHLIFDTLSWASSPFTYFLFYRFLNDFSLYKIWG